MNANHIVNKRVRRFFYEITDKITTVKINKLKHIYCKYHIFGFNQSKINGFIYFETNAFHNRTIIRM